MLTVRLCALAVAICAVAGCGAPATTTSAVSETTGVFWVPSCANGPLVLDGKTWYPVDPVSASDLKASPPTPGSGQGTFTLYSDGRAQWISMGGLYETWLSTTPQDDGGLC